MTNRQISIIVILSILVLVGPLVFVDARPKTAMNTLPVGRFQMQSSPSNFYVIDTTSGEIWWYNKSESWERYAPALRGHID